MELRREDCVDAWRWVGEKEIEEEETGVVVRVGK